MEFIMVFGLILILAVIVVLAFFVGKNIPNLCTIWFFKTYEQIPVAILVFAAFAAGIVFSIIVISFIKLNASPKKEKKEKLPKSKKGTSEVSDKPAEKINKKKSLLKKAEKAAKNSDSDKTIVMEK